MGTQNHYRSGSLNLNVRGLKQSATLAINEQSNALRRAGRRIYKLGLGQSPFPVPSEVVDALKHHAHEKDYLPVTGLPDDFIQRWCGDMIEATQRMANWATGTKSPKVVDLVDRKERASG